ncbi:MAG TPA: hypothetical protein VGM88_07740 [Kofleriaceae bacterium]|jgi:hypothetical protein
MSADASYEVFFEKCNQPTDEAVTKAFEVNAEVAVTYRGGSQWSIAYGEDGTIDVALNADHSASNEVRWIVGNRRQYLADPAVASRWDATYTLFFNRDDLESAFLPLEHVVESLVKLTHGAWFDPIQGEFPYAETQR